MGTQSTDFVARLRTAADWRIRRVPTAARQYSALVGWRRHTGPPGSVASGGLAPVDPNAQPVVMCTWQRLMRLERTCELLAAQSVPVELYLWNNNWEERERVAAVADAAPIPVHVVHCPRNIGGFGRFYLARKLPATCRTVVFIDDDQDFSPDTIAHLLADHRPLTLSGWWAWRFQDASAYSRRERAAPGEPAHYVGTCGMVVDSEIFRDERLFSCPRRFWFVEDLWLCYVAGHHLGWDMFRSSADFTSLSDEHALFPTLGKAKNRLLSYLVRSGWDLAVPAAS